LSLSGTSTFTCGINGPVRTIGSLRISMAKSDGNVFGGTLESALVAGCPIQVRILQDVVEIYLLISHKLCY